jgi:hypothetical protein
MIVNSDPDIIVVIEVKDGYRGLCFRSGNIFDLIHSAINITALLPMTVPESCQRHRLFTVCLSL